MTIERKRNNRDAENIGFEVLTQVLLTYIRVNTKKEKCICVRDDTLNISNSTFTCIGWKEA